MLSLCNATSLSSVTACPTNRAPIEHGPQSHGDWDRPALTLSGMGAHKRALSKIP